jgi:hypothetical protein
VWAHLPQQRQGLEWKGLAYLWKFSEKKLEIDIVMEVYPSDCLHNLQSRWMYVIEVSMVFCKRERQLSSAVLKEQQEGKRLRSLHICY